MSSWGIFLIGPMASGKSVVARELAALLGAGLIDTDHAIVAEHGSIPAIFEAGGESLFRDYESRALARAVEAARDRTTVVATGGGIVLCEANREILRGEYTVYLETDLATVRPRIENARHRPLLDGDPLDRWATIFAARQDFYVEAATLCVDARSGRPKRVAAEIAEAHRRASGPRKPLA
ncbi:shikimate kinase [Paeniglutamicibacter cryotolerans]|uniref:Shikimate kinase n=1 Tax=Paeniglutamicibacter cryotolerans TaxID=670079 RepID=A0A839QL45_9MICC|nr:shikimate kinase [Paeniglutamicibacter cryotolerans]MBB2997138.1 shikimate kinase [Paeniglutamicibacter cryotolerans]